MTLAICINCGDEKVGAWTECVSCGFVPESDDDLMKSLALSDWFLINSEELRHEWAESIKSGVKPALDMETRKYLSGFLPSEHPENENTAL